MITPESDLDALIQAVTRSHCPVQWQVITQDIRGNWSEQLISNGGLAKLTFYEHLGCAETVRIELRLIVTVDQQDKLKS